MYALIIWWVTASPNPVFVKEFGTRTVCETVGSRWDNLGMGYHHVCLNTGPQQ